MTNRLGALLRHSADGADQHRPQTRPEFIRAARGLAAQGLTPDDIGAALGLSTGAARELLHEPLAQVRPRFRGRR